MKLRSRILSALTSCALAVTSMAIFSGTPDINSVKAADSIADSYEWGTLEIGGGGFVSGIVAGKENMYLRTDVGGAYRYDYSTMRWEQLFGFLNDADRGFLSVKGMAIDPRDDDIVYFLCGCAYFSDAKTEVIKTTDGGKTFERYDVTDLIQVHGNGDGRECIEPIAIDPDNPDTIYAGGDVAPKGKSGLIKSTDGGKTWKDVEGYGKLGLFSGELKYPMWTDHLVNGTEGTKEYNQQNGIGTIWIEGGKVYVGTSVTGQANIHVADVTKDDFAPLSKDLPNANYPVSITSDKNGHLFFTYIAGLAFSGMAGGAYKYDIASGKVTKLTVSDNAIGMIEVDPTDPKKMVARTCGMWSDQWYGETWVEDDPNTPENEGSIAWGDHFFRSTDGGDTWENITPGQGPTDYSTGTGIKQFISLPIDTNGYDWVYGKACHWGSSIIIDPRNSDHIYLTSGNGVFRCDNVWDEKGIQFYFDPKGVEEVVCLDFVSVPGRNPFSAIGDYDGYEHLAVDEIGLQYKPNMGSTSAIAYCPQNPDIMIRIAEGDANNQASGYYSKDGGKTWEGMKVASGGKAAITELGAGKYRFLKSGKESGAVSYSDDWGATWKNASGISGYKPSYFLVDPEDPSLIYASAIIYNQYWSSNPNVTKPTFEESHHAAFISHDYGATWTETPITDYDCWSDAPGDPAYLAPGKVVYACGYNGLYLTEDEGKTFTSLDVNFAKTVGYGAPKDAGGPNTLFIYGKPNEADPEGIYRSSDGGKTWLCINTDHLYGGTGNGNLLVGDMNTFGTVYMSTVGCGIVYGRIAGAEQPPKPVTTTTTTKPAQTTTTTTATTASGPAATTTGQPEVTTVTTTADTPVSTTTTSTTVGVTTTLESAPPSATTTAPTEVSTVTTTSGAPANTTVPGTTPAPVTTTVLPGCPWPAEYIYGDVNLDGEVGLADVIALGKHLANPNLFPLGNSYSGSVERATEQADVQHDGVVDSLDISRLLEYSLGKLQLRDLGPDNK